ncbi:hypothetical protein [Streptomyces sp. NPDC093018]|uniref:hypothetical protein n=1 Tax=Streptomyces sp. NPDC093018 TaxID=3155067 RepID=UPI00343CEC34
MAINVGSVEVDVVPNTQGIYNNLRDALVPAATRAGEDAGKAAGRAFGPAMQGAVSNATAVRIGERLGAQIGRQIASQVATSLRDGVTLGGQQSRAPATRQGDATGSAFVRSFKARLEAALANLPDVRLNANSTDAERELANLRAQMESLRDVRIGIDISSAEAAAIIDRLQERLHQLSTESPDVSVRVDAGAASAQLAAFQAEVNRLDGQTADVDVDTHAATSSLNVMTAAAVAFGPALIPVLPVVAAGLGAIAAAAVAAGAGIGGIALVAVPAFKQISTVLQAQKAAQDAAASATANGGQAAAQASSRALQLASAQQAVATAERNGARQIAQAEQQVSQARQSAAQTAQQAALQNQQAARAVASAEKDLTDAQTAAVQAQKNLTAARQQAVQELQDLNNQLTDSTLAQKQAEFDLADAKKQRDAVFANTASTDDQRARAQLAYDQAVQALKEQQLQTQRLKTQTDAANKAGVKGSQTYKNAQDQLTQAQQAVADKTQALKDAQDAQARTATQNAQQIAQAQQRIADAQSNVANAQQQAADQAASAQRQLQQAQLSAAGGADAAATAQAKYKAELAKLTPSARTTYNAFIGLRTAFSSWSRSLQPAVMPIFTRALNGLKAALPGLTPFVLNAADAITDLQDRASRQIKTPFWQGFKKDLQGSVKPAIKGLGIAFGNVLKGMAGIVDGFLPHMNGISSTLQRITGRFAKWGAGLKGSPQFQNFLSYAADKGPLVAATLGKIVGAIINIGKALAPVSGPLLKMIGGLAQGIGWLAVHVPGLIPMVYGLYVATKLWIAAQLLLNGVMAAFQLISEAGPWGWIVLGIAAVVIAVTVLWTKCAWFRDAIKGTWELIKVAAQVLITWFKGPFVDFFTKTIPAAFRVVIDWVKKNWPWILGALTGPIGLAVVYIIKHWGQIKSGFSDVWDWLKKWVFYPIRDFFTKTIPGWGVTLTNKIVGSFEAAQAGIKTAWDKIKDIAKTPVKYVVDVVYNNGIRKVWNLVTDAFGGKHLGVMKFATGGIMPGYTPGRDVHLVPSTAGPVALSGGEAIMRPEWTRAVGPGYVNAMNAAARAGGVSGVRNQLGFAGGGIFDGIGNVLSSGWDKVKKGASWLKDTFGSAIQAGVKSVVTPLINKIPGGNIGVVGLLKDLMKGAVTKLVGAGKKGDDAAAPNVKYSPTKGVEQWRGVVQQALRQVGQPQSYANITLRRMQQESGGNPTVVNKWDSNWKAGHPSVGLMQVIRGTFRSFAGKYRNTGPFLYGVSVNPLANVYSSMKYALGAYGSLPAAYNRAGGYDSGGWMPPGMNLMYNGLGQPEAVLTPSQWSAIQGAAVRGSDGPTYVGLQSGDQMQLVVDDQSFTAYVDGRAHGQVASNNRQLMTALGARPR